MPSSRYERALRREGFKAIAGVDEAGRGALFGPVFAAAVILDPQRPIRGLDDSKVLEPERRQVLAQRIRERATAWSVAGSDAFEIDRINILQASRRAMLRAVEGLKTIDGLRVIPDHLLIDAVAVDSSISQTSLIHGDARSFSIAAASILAKTARDEAMQVWDRVFPGYGLAECKGYATPEHRRALLEMGPTPLHRFSFEPVRESGSTPWEGYPVPQPPQGVLFACK